ncbi:SacI homology domain-containing protein [Kalaharituber pfeilii]|nr:SacI homology domain-containing protein [Kalaharituber pfeilii]
MSPATAPREAEGSRSSGSAPNRAGGTVTTGDVGVNGGPSGGADMGDTSTPAGSVPNSLHSTMQSSSDPKSSVGSLISSISEGSSGSSSNANHCPDPVDIGKRSNACDTTEQEHLRLNEQPEIIRNEILGDIIRPPMYSPLEEKHPTFSHPTFPQLSNNQPASPQSRPTVGDKDEESSVPKPFDRSEKKPFTSAQSKKEIYEKDEGIRRMHKFTLYETTMRYYIVGADLLDSRFRILKIDRTVDVGDLSVIEDEVEYTREEMARLLATIEDGNIMNGGLKHRCTFWGLLGFIRFTGAYYMLLITKRSIVAMIGGHHIYQIDDTELVPLTTAKSNSKKSEQTPEEARFVHILGNLDLSRSFYFSYSYDITHTLQHNIARERDALEKGFPRPGNADHNDMFVWNHYLLKPAIGHIGKNTFDWCLPIIHGYVDQATRRSRHFAGARFLKRGANDLGYVANDVETEQIVSEMLSTSFHAPGNKLYSNPNYTSYVQHRGSIPLFWTQENNAATPKPPIECREFHGSLHFDNMFQRYGTPVIVLNLVKSRERVARESILLKEFTQAIMYLNQFLPKEHRIQYIAWDMSRASKSRDQDVIETLEDIAEQVVNTTGFFHNGYSPEKPPSMQDGVCRTNCIDCLDRTNAAQFVIGKRALGHQLHALGVITETSVDYDTDAVNLFTHMYHDHGDTIAVQYAGSHLVNTMETYRKINQWTSHSRDMLESFKRYYNNSFLDAQRQEAINLFLGNYVFVHGEPMLWDLTTDYHLHHLDPRKARRRRSYVKWWTPCNLEKRVLPEASNPTGKYAGRPLNFFDDYWLEYYRPKAVSSFAKVFSYNLNSTFRYIPLKMTQEGKYDLSPFKVRIMYADSMVGDPGRRKGKGKRKSVKIALQLEDVGGSGVGGGTGRGGGTGGGGGGAGARIIDDDEDLIEDGGMRTGSNQNGTAVQTAPMKTESQLKRITLQKFPWVTTSETSSTTGASTTQPDQPLHQNRPTQQQQTYHTQQNHHHHLHSHPPSVSLNSTTSSRFIPAATNTTSRNYNYARNPSASNSRFYSTSPTKSSFSSSATNPGPTSFPHALPRPPNHPPTHPHPHLLSTSQLPLDELVPALLSPSVSPEDEDEYARYMSHPLNLPLVTSSTTPLDLPHPNTTPKHPVPVPTATTRLYSDFVNYVNIPLLGVDSLEVKPKDVATYKAFVQLGAEGGNVLGMEPEEEGTGIAQSNGGNGNVWRVKYKWYHAWLTKGKLKNMGMRGGVGGMGVGLGGDPGVSGGGMWFAPDGGVVGGLRQAMGTRMMG